MNINESLDRVLRRHDELTSLLADPAAVEQGKFADLSREYAELEPVVEAVRSFRAASAELADLETMQADGDDPEMAALARDEAEALRERLPELERNLQLLLLPKDDADTKNAILEIRAGTGGDEAALFAADLFRMYQRYADAHGWKFEVIEVSENGIGGFKEATASVRGHDVFSRLKFESGVHRVQRIPVTESGGRIHTSAATVAVLPEAEEFDIDIDESDLRIDTYRSQGAGGQHVNTTDSAIRITHVPTGVVVTCQDEKSQHKNKAKAMRILRARLYDSERQRREDERAANRKSQVGSGDRSERIRTYNFPQGRVTDHRINVTVHKLDRFMAGEMDDVIGELIATDQAERLAALGD
ncbi:MAG: peptide chain release factor 1 [Rhodospirillales bacterium]